MGLLGKLLSAGVKTVVLPFAVINDTSKAVTGRLDEVGDTGEVLGSIGEDLLDGIFDPLGLNDDDDY